MKYTNEVIIKRSRAEVVRLFDDPENLKKWMKGMQSFEHLSGEAGQPGAKSLLKFDMGKRKMEMIETVTVRNLPDEFSGTYEVKGVFNKIRNLFIEVDENTTRYVTENEFDFTGFMKIIGWLFPSAFRKQSQQYLEDFKNFVENSEV